MQKTQYSDLTRKGQEIYDTTLKAILEPEHNGEFVVIEPESGDYYLGKTSVEASTKAREAHPESKFFLARVGFKAAYKFTHRTAL